jgi:hypothetical protein
MIGSNCSTESRNRVKFEGTKTLSPIAPIFPRSGEKECHKLLHPYNLISNNGYAASAPSLFQIKQRLSAGHWRKNRSLFTQRNIGPMLSGRNFGNGGKWHTGIGGFFSAGMDENAAIK